MMPRCNGYEVLERMGESADLRDVPVVMLSADSELDSVVRCIKLGAVDYLQKPFNPVLLRARVGATLEKKRLRDEAQRHLARLEQDLDAGRKLQLAMVPTEFPEPTPERPVEVSARMVPAREVGGDLYDVFTAENGKLCFLIGDVSGKGVASALFMARTKSLLRTIASMPREDGGAASAGEIVSRVNRELCQDNDIMMFVTLFFGVLNGRTGLLEFCNAGHDAPFLIRPDGLGRVSGTRAMALGVLDGIDYPTDRLEVAPGESLFLFTDGITEATDAEGGMFTETRLAPVLSDNAAARPAKLVSAVSEAVAHFLGDTRPSDDITALALRRLG
jgi:phosphoserine phosphatase RsbU/P